MKAFGHPVASLSDEELLERAHWMKTDTPPEELDRYLRSNLGRIREALMHVPPAQSDDQRLLDLGCYAAMIPWYADVLGYRDITGVAYEPRMHFHRDIKKVEGVTDLKLDMAFLNVEEDNWPFADESFNVVLCFELLEHMATDPMHMMAELNRVMVPGGVLVLTTPNSASWAALARVVLGEQPYNWTAFYGVPGLVNRHNREYTPREVARLVEDTGLEVTELITFQRARLSLGRKLVARWGAIPGILSGRGPVSHRGQKILVSARKTGPVRRRWPRWLYKDPSQMADKLAEMGERGRRTRTATTDV
jgi:SAM-dependent methyltransferase